jgi:hypothetical protein
MADKKISQLSAASTPLAGTEVLPIVQSGSTVKVASDNLTVKNIRSNATTGILQVAGPAAASTRVMTTPDANFTAARTDAAQTFTGAQSFSDTVGATKLIPTGGTVSGNGMYLPASNAIGISTGGADAIRINSSQQTGFGNTLPAFRVHATQTSAGAATTVACLENGGTTTSTEARLLFVQGGNTTRGGYVGGLNEASSGSPTSLVFGTSAAFATPTEKMRITSAGNVTVSTGNLAFGTSGKGIADTNGNESMLFTATASAVNELTVANAATGNNPAISATGDDTNIGITLTPKGTGNLGVSAGNVLVNTTTSSYDTAKVGGTHKFLNVQSNSSSYAVGTLAGSQTAAGDRLGVLAFVNNANSASYKYTAWVINEAEGSTANQLGSRLALATLGDGSAAGPIERLRADSKGNVIVNTAAIATTATDGFLYVPTCAGTPTGTPTTYTGRAPIVVDTTNNKLYFYSSGQWRDAGP